MTSIGHFSQTQLAGVDAALNRFERSELDRRRLEAEQLIDLSAAVEAAVGDRAAPSAARELAYRSLRLELASMLHEGEGSVERLLDTAYVAWRHFPDTLDALRLGEISLAHLKVITAEGTPLIAGNTGSCEERRATYEAAVIAVAKEDSPGRLRPIARRLAAAQQEAEREGRHNEAKRRRHVRVTDAGDGMADLTAYLPAEEAYAIYDRLTRIAKASQRSATEGALAGARSRDEGRADTLRDLLLELPGANQDAAESIRAQIQVVVPADVLGVVRV